MKKYVKPDLVYEDFMLSHNIAACNPFDESKDTNAKFSDGATCTYDFVYAGIVLFSESNTSCEGTPAQYDEEYCLQTGMDGYNFFAS